MMATRFIYWLLLQVTLSLANGEILSKSFVISLTKMAHLIENQTTTIENLTAIIEEQKKLIEHLEGSTKENKTSLKIIVDNQSMLTENLTSVVENHASVIEGQRTFCKIWKRKGKRSRTNSKSCEQN